VEVTGADPQDEVQQPAGEVSADLMPRFLARLIDGLLLGFLMFVIIVPIVFVGIFGTSGYSAFGGFGLSSIVISLVFTTIVIGYFAYLESSRGQTVGKMVMKLKTVGPDGQNPSFESAAKRSGFYALAIIPVIGGLLELGAVIYIAYTINESPAHTGWHDEFAGGTRVIKLS
jgi:uncharacterized RDD family membrane protein YckC